MSVKREIIRILLIIDCILLVFALLNSTLLWNKAGLPKEYKTNISSLTFQVKHINKVEQIIEFDGKKIDKPGLIAFYLMKHRINDSVTIKSILDDKIIVRHAILSRHFQKSDIIILIMVTLLYFFTGIYILLKYKTSEFAFIMHLLSVCTGVMVLYDWGDLFTYPKIISYIILSIFEIGIFMVPTLFLHFSFNYPVSNSKYKFIVLVPFYSISIVSIIISLINLTRIIFLNVDINDTNFLLFHTIIADIFLIVGLISTVAKLEHSALTITDALSRNQIYWVLLGISFGPLIYVFLRLMPRLLLGYELVSEVFLDITIIVAPIMFLVSVSRKK